MAETGSGVIMVNTAPAKAGGFPGKLGRNRLASPLIARSMREVRPLEHDAGRRHISVERASAVAAVHSLREFLRLDRAAVRAGLLGSTRIDQHDDATSVCSFEGDVLNEHSPRHPGHIKVLEGDVREAVHQRPRELVRKVPALVGNAGVQPGDPQLRFALPPAMALLAGDDAWGAAQGLGGFGRPRRRRHRFSGGRWKAP